MSHVCPVCGFIGLSQWPRSLSGGASFEICVSCGYQHGVDDDDKHISHAAWRERWLVGGARWASSNPAPKNRDASALAARVTPVKGARTIVITGGTRGCGRALVEAFASAHTVIACGRSDDAVADLRKKFAPPHDFTSLDVANDEAVGRWAECIVATHGAPDLLVNNAAVIAPNAPLWTLPDSDIARVLDVNVRGTVNTIRHFVPAMVAAKRGVIVNFSSGWGRSTSPEVAIYCASKFAIEGLTQALAQELPKGLAAVALNPGIINTEMLRSCFGGGASSYPTPIEWAKSAAPFLLELTARDNGGSLDVPGAATD
jgi:NAD(P)-dependent dehydrogenase (short-subunit alcohol dehydrogenase family)